MALEEDALQLDKLESVENIIEARVCWNKEHKFHKLCSHFYKVDFAAVLSIVGRF